VRLPVVARAPAPAAGRTPAASSRTAGRRRARRARCRAW
jgi:hypothetical protein